MNSYEKSQPLRENLLSKTLKKPFLEGGTGVSTSIIPFVPPRIKKKK